MSIRPRLGAEALEVTARMARASNPAGTTAMWVRDRLGGLWADEDFAGWYPRDGRPGISPAQLATVRHHGRGSVRGRRLPGRGGRGPGGWDGLGNQQLAGLVGDLGRCGARRTRPAGSSRSVVVVGGLWSALDGLTTA